MQRSDLRVSSQSIPFFTIWGTLRRGTITAGMHVNVNQRESVYILASEARSASSNRPTKSKRGEERKSRNQIRESESTLSRGESRENMETDKAIGYGPSDL